jgi:hypothetical protein
MGQLYDLRTKIEAKIATDHLDATDIKGKIGLKTGRLLAFISSSTPDDPAGIAKLKQAAKEVLNINL